MQAQAQITLRQIKDLLKKVNLNKIQKQYKATLSLVDRAIDKLQQNISHEYKYWLIHYQSEGINKLLLRNLLKKYKYQQQLMRYMIKRLLKNIKQSHTLLLSYLKNASIISYQSKNNQTGDYFKFGSVTQKVRVSIKRQLSLQQKKGKNMISKFIQLINKTINNLIITFHIYKWNLNDQTIVQWIQTIKNRLFVSNIQSFSHGKILLVLGRIFTFYYQNKLLQGKLALEKSCEMFIQCLLGCNKIVEKDAFRYKKYQKRQQECYKLIICGLVMLNRNCMKQGKQNIAVYGINSLKTSLANLRPELNVFKKALQPQIYLQQQFMRYRSQKQALVQISSWFFQQFIKKQQQKEDLLEQMSIKCLIKNQFQGNQTKRHNHRIGTLLSPYNQRQRKTLKSIINSQPNIMSQIQSTRSIFNNIDEMNDFQQAYQKLRQNSKNRLSAALITQKNKKNLKKQKLINKKIQQQSCLEKYVQNLIIQQQKNSIQFLTAKQALTRRKQYGKKMQQQQIKFQLPKDIVLNKIDQQTLQQVQQRIVKRQINMMNRLKSKVFLDLLIKNRQFFGIKKISEKIQILKKKEEERQKMISNRLTSMVNHEHFSRNSNYKFQLIAKQLLKKHAKYSVLRHDNPYSAIKMMQTQRKIIESSYTLSQNSIDTIKMKLTTKMNNHNKNENKDQRNEQIFKQKLKRLGSSNFLLKLKIQNNDFLQI